MAIAWQLNTSRSLDMLVLVAMWLMFGKARPRSSNFIYLHNFRMLSLMVSR